MAEMSVIFVISREKMDFISLISLLVDVMKPSNWDMHDLDEDMKVGLVS